MGGIGDEDEQLREVVLQNAQAIRRVRERAEADLRALADALQEETRVLEILSTTGASIASKLELQALVQQVTDAATALSGAKFGAFFYNVENEQGQAFLLYTLSGAPREAFERFGLPRNTEVFRATFHAQGTLRVEDITKDPRYGKMAPHYGMPKGHLPVRSYLAVPVVSRSGAAIGGLFFGHPEPGVFTERAERLVEGIAAQAAIAIDNARLYEQAQKSAAERETLLASEQAARAQAERMSEMKDQFLATLSHELRTPLSAILGWAQVLRRRSSDPEALQQGLETIERNARMQSQLIEDLLDMSRITSGKLRLDVQAVDPETFIRAAVETVRPAAEAKRIRLETSLDAAAGAVAGDPSRLQQVMWNLLSNAVKFTGPGGRVDVVLRRAGEMVEISVADTGIGIGAEFLDQLFQRFQQADASSTRKHGGLGLGLSIVRSLVELHGGVVRASSPGEGHGTTFVVQLPRSVQPGARSGGAPQRRAQGQALPMDYRVADLDGIKILVVDDEPDARTLLQRLLADCNAQVLVAAGAEEALALLQKEHPDVLVSDIGMPGIDGYELLRRVRALDGVGKVPAVALTAFARSEDRTRALRAGYVVHVPKPVEPTELVATVASVVGRLG